jgi:ABC-type dipeptide/oligopeptide/nickel transport system permease component
VPVVTLTGLPTFFLGIILLILAQGLLPVGGMVTPGLKPEDGWDYWTDVGKHLILPTLTMAIIYTSSYILTALKRDGGVERHYILTAVPRMSTGRILRRRFLKRHVPMVRSPPST